MANAVSGAMATALATITAADRQDDRGDRSRWPSASPAPLPAHPAGISINDDEEWFVFFMPSLPFRDLMQDRAVIINTLQYAWDRGRDNPLFTAGDILYNGVIIREVPEMPVIAGAGGGGIDVAASVLCGAQAVGVAWAQRMKSTTNGRDYSYFHGVGLSGNARDRPTTPGN